MTPILFLDDCSSNWRDRDGHWGSSSGLLSWKDVISTSIRLNWFPLCSKSLKKRGESLEYQNGRNSRTFANSTFPRDAGISLQFGFSCFHLSVGACQNDDNCCSLGLYDNKLWLPPWLIPTVSANWNFYSGMYRFSDDCRFSCARENCQTRCQVSNNGL